MLVQMSPFITKKFLFKALDLCQRTYCATRRIFLVIFHFHPEPLPIPHHRHDQLGFVSKRDFDPVETVETELSQYHLDDGCLPNRNSGLGNTAV